MSNDLEAIGLAESVEPMVADKFFSILVMDLVAGWAGTVESSCHITWDAASCAELDGLKLFVDCLELIFSSEKLWDGEVQSSRLLRLAILTAMSSC